MNFHFAHSRAIWLSSLVVIAALILSACGTLQVPQTGTQTKTVAVEITDTEVKASGPAVPGVNTISVNNTSQTTLSLFLARLNTDVTIDQFMETLKTDDMAAVGLVKLGGGRNAPAGETNVFTADLKEGTYAVVAFPQGEGAPLITSLEVTGSASGQTAPEADLKVDMVDFAFVLPGEITAGQQTWEVTNSGAQWHELVIIKPAQGFTQEQLLELFSANEEPSGPPPFEEVASFGPLSEGERGWITFDLPPGTYMAVCFLPDFASGQAHLEKGMIYTFEVK